MPAVGRYAIVPGGNPLAAGAVACAGLGAATGFWSDGRPCRLKDKEAKLTTATSKTNMPLRRNFLGTISKTLFPECSGILARPADTLMLLMFSNRPRFSLFKSRSTRLLAKKHLITQMGTESRTQSHDNSAARLPISAFILPIAGVLGRKGARSL